MSEHTEPGLPLFLNWAKELDVTLLRNEDDVETKFVLPLFQHLGYSEPCRRGKFAIDDYLSEKRRTGRKHEIDQIYFSTDDPDKQNADTSLLIIEAKNPDVSDLERAIEQAKYYGNHLTPIFLAVTNGHRLIILKRNPFRSEEKIFDTPVTELRNEPTAIELYNQLQFELVKHLKEQGIDPLTHALYVDMLRTLDRYPDIQAQLSKGDFTPSTVQDGRRLTVIKPRVAIICELPVAHEEGGCRIKFSNIMLRGFECYLTHAKILRYLLIGLQTSPQWQGRPFLKKTEQKIFEAHLGQTGLLLPEQEAQELCAVVDIVCQKYKAILIETANILETWNFLPMECEDMKGFRILSVKRWLWDLMEQFSKAFDYDEGDSDWHYGSPMFLYRPLADS